MKMILKLAHSAPMAVICCIFLVACQSSVDSNAERYGFAGTAVQQANLKIQDSSSFRERLQQKREELKARQEKRKTERLAKQKERSENRALKRQTAATARFEREDTLTVWERFKRRDNKSVIDPKKKAAAKPTGRGKYSKLIAKYAAEHGVPYQLARAVVQVESTFRPNVTGRAGEIGLMQIKLATARGMGYKGSRKALYDPATNLYWGMKYLGKAHRLAGGSTCGTILKYNAGHGAKKMNRVSSRYCGRIKRILA